MRERRFLLGALLMASALFQPAAAVTPLPSADGQFWDVQDTTPWAQDSGAVATGGRSNPFNGFGYLKLQVRRVDGAAPSVANRYLRGFGLARDGERFDSLTPVLHDGVVVARALFAPADTSYLRYYDSFHNSTDEPRIVEVAWGGATGAYEDGGLVAVAESSSGDRVVDRRDTFVTVMQNAHRVDDPRRGPSGHGPSAHVLGDAAASAVLLRAGDMYANPFGDAYPGFDPAHIGYVFRLELAPGETEALVTFVAKGLSEVYDPRGGFPIAHKDALLSTWSDPVYTAADARVPAPGSEIARVTAVARRLVASPDLRGLTRRQRAAIVNWTPAPAVPLPAFTVAEASVAALQTAMGNGTTTSEDIVREYLTRATLYDRHGPTYRSILALSPRAIADARARDLERVGVPPGSGTVRSALHGVPVLLKDNIDTTELPTTGGALALVDHRPRIDSHIAAGLKAGGAVILGKANLDEFPFGDFGVSSVGGTIGNAYDPSLSTAGSSGGSATAVAASLAALAFGTDTCNSLSNPSGFASLATIRTTRGLTSRAGVMPLNPYNDAVGPMGRNVLDVALALGLVTGPDPADPVTLEGARNGVVGGGVGSASLRGVRVGFFRQRFIGITGEREAAEAMERVAGELRAAGAMVVDVAIPNYDEEYAKARGTAPGSLKAAWETYLARGQRVMTIDALIRSGKMAPAGQRRLEGALATPPPGQTTEAFLAARARYRDLLVAAMDAQQVEALLYPANQARPHTHEGGAERYGTEPGTCEESAASGLPQVTVPAGFMGGRYPVGVSFLGRMWHDGRLLDLARAYEQATRHRRPPR